MNNNSNELCIRIKENRLVQQKKQNRQAALAAAEHDDRPLEFVLTTVEQIRSIASPIRLQILRALSESAKTTKQVATELGEPATGLYRHVEALSEAGLIELIAEVPKRGTIQKFFRSVARSFRADDSCFADRNYPNAKHQALSSLLEGTRVGITHGFHNASNGQCSQAIAGSCLLDIEGAEQAKELLQLVLDSVAKWAESNNVKINKRKRSTKLVSGQATRLTVFIHPEPSIGNNKQPRQSRKTIT